MKPTERGRLEPAEPNGASGEPTPLGATWLAADEAWNVSLYSRHATGVTLLLYGESDPARPLLEARLDPLRNKTGRIWHRRVPAGEAPGARFYAWRVEGPRDPAKGHRFDPEKILFDPYAEEIFFPPAFSRQAAAEPGANDGRAPLGVLPRRDAAPGAGGAAAPGPAPARHTHDAIVYELHVRGFTARANSGVRAGSRGTFLGLIEKIPYLKELGVTVVELLPVQQFDPQEGNYWGYMTLSFFAPHGRYGLRDAAAEFREMVEAFHRAGIEVWLDVVYNHTCEAGENGPTYSYRGMDDGSYYLLDGEGRYRNDSGCGNVTRAAHPAVRVLVLRSLRHWIERMGVDGFRFDLASLLARNADGSVNSEDPPLILEISMLAALGDVRLAAEAWDIGAYLLGRGFPGVNWLQWNGRFRDDLRSFVKGDAGMVGPLARALYGSDDLFPDGPGDVYRPWQSVNFITAHDGFCLYDLVAYDRKHNEANGHGGADGSDDNRSWNCGWEGDAGAPPEVLALRRRQVKNFFALLMLANGTPMFCAGDEFLNTQRGNNNPYNQDNETTWLDWALLERNRDVFRFFRGLIAFRKARRSIARGRFWRGDVAWYGSAGPPDWGRESRCVAYRLRGADFGEPDLYVMINGHWDPVRFRIQEGGPGSWRRIADTALPGPQDVSDPGAEPALDSLDYELAGRSVVILESRKGPSGGAGLDGRAGKR